VADTNHLSHRLVRRGLSQPAAVALIWALAAAVSVIALLL
jgi:UDP-N-acetylmuramyl pentapeptide phosphotransferase/UDP-N-acetylglucosamine-1-phosphate transferase